MFELGNTRPPFDELPALLPLEAVVGRGADAVVMLTGGLIYSTGLRVDLGFRDRSSYLKDVGATEIMKQMGGDPDDGDASKLHVMLECAGRELQFLGLQGGSDWSALDYSRWIPEIPTVDVVIRAWWPARRIEPTPLIIPHSLIVEQLKLVQNLW